MAEEEEEKGFGRKILETFLRVGSRLPQARPRVGSLNPTLNYGPPLRSRVAGPQNAIQARVAAGIDAKEAPDPVPLPGPVQEASEAERRGLAANEPVLFDAGLVTVQGKSTPAGRALFKSAQEKGQDPNQMVDFYARGFVDENLRVTEKGRIFENIDRTNSLDSILAINDRKEGFRLYLEAAESGAVTEWQNRTGAGADTWQEFLDQAVENFPNDAAEVLKLVKGFVPGGAAFFEGFYRDNPLGYFGGVVGAALKLGKGKLSPEEEAEFALMRDEYLREGVFRTAASYSNGLVAALTHGPGTKEFFTDRDRALAKYHFWKDQYDVDNMEAGEATAEVVGFAETVKETIADDVSFFDGKATAQEELQEVETAKSKAGQSVQDAVAYLDQLDVVDPQSQPRAEQVRELMLPFSSIASPDVIGSIGLGSVISGAFKMGGKVSRLRKDLTDKKAERRRVDAQLQATEAAQKRATPAAQAQFAPARMRGPSTADLAKLQNRRTKLDTEIAKLETRIGRIDGTVPGRVAGFIGSVGRSARSVPLRAAGATASVTGNILQRLGNFVGPVAGAVVAGSALGGAPLGYGVGLLAGRALGLGARGKTLSRFGEKMSRVGQEFSRRRMAYPMFRKFAQEAKTNKLKQYHLGREAAYGLTVGLTAKFAKLWRDAFLGELPFSYVASGGFSQVGGNFLSQAAAESLLIEGPIIGAGKMLGRAAGMQLSGDVKEHNRLAYNAALNFRDQFLTDPEQRAAFDSLPPIVKRMYGNAYTNNPDLKIQFITDLEEGSGLYDPDSNTITINPNDPRGVETILAHEFRHHMDTQGFRQAIIEASVGPRGFLRQTPAEDSATGVGELIPEFKEWAESYNQIRIESGRKPYDLNNPEELGDVVMEWSAYSSMDSVAAGLRNNVLIEWSRRHPWLRSFYDSLLGRFFRKDSLMNAGLLFDQNGNLATQPGLPGMAALKQHPALSARLERMMKDRAGIGFTAEELSDFDDPDSKKKRPSPTAIRKTDTEALKEVQRDMHMDLKTDQQGNVVEVGGVAEIKPEPPPRELLPVLPDKDFDAPRVNEGRGTDNATDLTGALTAPVLNKDGTRKDIIPGKPTELVRRDENVEALKAHFREGYGYNDLQLGMIDDLIDIMSDPDRRGEAVLGYYFPVWAKQRKKARKGDWKQFVPTKGIDPKWYRFVPYALVQTDVGNVIVKSINMDQVVQNAQTIAKSKKGIEAYQGDVSSLMDDFEEMVRNHGRNIQNAARFTPDKLALLNAVFGDVGRGHKEANLLLQKDPQISQVRSAVRSFRIERFSQMNSGIKAGFPFSLEKTKAMEMPARDPQVQQALPLPETIEGTPTTTPEPSGKFVLAEAIGDADKNFASRQNMRAGTGVAKNDRIRFEIDGKPLTLGADTKGPDQGKAWQDWTEETEAWLSPEEIQEFSQWYEEIEGFFVNEFGSDAEKWMLAWLASQQNESPTGGIRNASRVLDSLMGMNVINPNTGKPQRGGLAHDKLVAIFQGTSPEKGFGPKLADFLDAGLRRKTRTYHGDRKEAGMPFVADVHTGRDSGHVDQQTLTRLKDMADNGRLTRNGNPVTIEITKAKTKVVKDAKGRKKEKVEPEAIEIRFRGGKRTLEVDMRGSPSGGQYEGISSWGNALTQMLNSRSWQGRNDWTPAGIQAIGWMRTLRQHGRPEETIETSLDRNTYRISQEVDYDLAGLGPQGLPVFASLPREVKTKVTQEVLEPFVGEVVKEVAPGAVLRGIAFGKGYWEGSAAPSAQFWVMGSEEAAANVELAMAWIGEQAGTARVVIGKGGKNNQAIVIRNPDKTGLTDEQVESLTQFIIKEKNSSDKNRAKDAQVLVGYSNHILPGDGGVISFGLTEAKVTAAKRTLERWLETLDYDLRIATMPAQASFSGNNWKDDPDGQGYLREIERRGSVAGIREKLIRLRGRYWTSVRQALRRYGGEQSGVGPGEPGDSGGGAVEFQQGEMPGLSPPASDQ